MNQGNSLQSNSETLERTCQGLTSNINISAFLASEIVKFIQEQISYIVSRKGEGFTSIYYSYEYQIRYLQRIMGVFNNHNSIVVLNNLYKQSSEKTLKFLEILFDCERTFELGIDFYKSEEEKITQYKKQIKLADQLLNSDSGDSTKFMKRLVKFQTERRVRLEELRVTLKGNALFAFLLLNRKRNMSNALPIYFVREFYYHFQTEFGAPMYSQILCLIDTIFGLSWSHDDIKKYCRSVKECMKRGIIQ